MPRPVLDPTDARRLAAALNAYARLKPASPADSVKIADAVIAAAVDLCAREVLVERIMAACADDPAPETAQDPEPLPLFAPPVVES